LFPPKIRHAFEPDNPYAMEKFTHTRMIRSVSPFLFLIGIILGFGKDAVSFDRVTADTKVSLLTASPGEELYSIFGHSALRVHDPFTGLDEVYNYGTFDFNTPNFYLKFTRGQLLYQLSVTTFEVFLAEYHYEGRAVYEQTLNLRPDEIFRLYDFLSVNRLPENRSYLYDFFFDNCATRIRDVVDAHVGIVWSEDVFQGPPRTFREMLQPYVGNMPWAAFGIDLALGLPADEIAAPWDYMFLPDEMFMAFAYARRTDGSPLVEDFREVLTESIVRSEPHFFSPRLAMWLIFLIGGFSLVSPNFSRGFDLGYFTLLGIGGLVVFFLWFLSDHGATKNNLVLLWMLPTHLYFIFRAFKARGTRRFPLRYFQFVFGLNLLFLLLWGIVPQGFNPAFFPLVLIAAVKAFFIGFRIEGIRGLRSFLRSGT
jgi:hypothetical protein